MQKEYETIKLPGLQSSCRSRKMCQSQFIGLTTNYRRGYRVAVGTTGEGIRGQNREYLFGHGD
jgi:hypothetical protein